ncbi:hypothetical protein [Eleftheria terrae]|uniref:hypothetical protein n=1 Tax=Eleftheria terrae TaxID=1597781 RepID=UPI00263B5B3A|nr:hypothetical protein [Eleftheria terrae]WKB53355.1 hypothetical protein N7L95_02860 [Eleftheria terrae]
MSVDLQRRRLLVEGATTALNTTLAASSLAGCGGGQDVPAEATGSAGQAQGLSGFVDPYTFEVKKGPDGSAMTSPVSNGETWVIANTGGKRRVQCFAGVPKARADTNPTPSAGLIKDAVAQPWSVQFGTSDRKAYTACTFDKETQDGINQNMEASGDPPCRVEVQAASLHQHLGEKRVFFNAEFRRLFMLQRKGDGLVARHPRVQLYSHQVPNRRWLRFYCHFHLGDAAFEWNLKGESVLIFQFKGENKAGSIGQAFNYPSVTLELRKNTLDQEVDNKFDVVMTRRLRNEQPEQEVARVPGLLVVENGIRQVHRFVIDIFPDWLSQADGGQASLALWHDRQAVRMLSSADAPRYFLTDNTIYGPATPDLYRAMWGLYRYRLTEPANNDACIVWHHAEVRIADPNAAGLNPP